jgi:putative membrane protein
VGGTDRRPVILAPGLLLLIQSRPEFSWTAWNGDGTLRAGLVLLAGLYLLGIGPIRRRFRLARRVDRRQVATFLGGVLLLLLALDGPLHELSDFYLFSAHMLQHMVLTLFAPPLLLMGTPGWLLRPLIRPPAVRRVAWAITSPIPAFLLFNIAFTMSHFPRFYELTLRDHGVHIAEHILFLATAVLTWWPILSPLPELPRLSRPLQLLYVFGQTFSGFLVGAFITNTQQVLYPFYAEAPRVWGITPLDDQRIGGLLMWIGGGVFLLLVFSAIFFVWAHEEGVADDVAQPLPRRRPAPRQPVAVAAKRPTPVLLGEEHVVSTAPDQSRLN